MIRRRKGLLREQQAFEGINITPFTDVLLVLLIIFMIAGSAMAPTGVGLTAFSSPETSHQDQSASDQLLTVEIDSDGRTRLSRAGVALSWEQVADLPNSTAVSLSIEAQTPAETVIRQYDRLLDLGLREIEWAPPRPADPVREP